MTDVFAYYPGCSGLGTSKEYDDSTRAVCGAMGIALLDIPDWSCCGSSPAHTFDDVLSAALSARNFQLVQSICLDTVLTPCPSCLSNMKTSSHRMRQETFRKKVNRLLDEPMSGRIQSMSVLQAIVEIAGVEAVASMVSQPLSGLRLAPYYGCLMNRPSDIMGFDDPENPTAIDRILAALGAEVVPFPLKVECCGGSFGVPCKDIVARLSGKLLACARDMGADAMVVACPMCQMNLDLRQSQLSKAAGVIFEMPVFYFTQLMGLAMGLPPGKLGFEKLCVSPKVLLSKVLAAAS